MGAVAEGQDVARTALHVEFAGVRTELALVTVARPVHQQHPAAGRHGGVADGHVASDGAGQRLGRRGEPQELVDGAGDQVGLFDEQTPLVGSLVQQLHRTAQHAGGGVVSAGDHREREGQHRQHAGDVAVGADTRGNQMRDGVVFGFGAAAFDQLGEVGHHRPDRVADGFQRARDAALGGVRRDDGFGPAVELSAVFFRDAEIVRDDHRRQRLEEFGDDVAATVGE